MTEKELTEIEGRANDATAGKLAAYLDGGHVVVDTQRASSMTMADVDFYEGARADALALCEALREANARADRLIAERDRIGTEV